MPSAVTIRYIFLLCFLAISSLNYAQTVKGTVLTNQEEPIPYATIQIGDDYGVITNDEGRFTISTNGFQQSDSVTISCLGYEKLALQLTKFTSQDYVLKEQVNELTEVYLTNRELTVDSIMYYVNLNLKKNYNIDQQAIKFFGRRTEYILGKAADFEIEKSTGFNKKQLEAFNQDFDKLETSLINNQSKQYTDLVANLYILNQTESKLHVEKAIRLLDEKNNQSVEKLFEKGTDIVLKHLDKDKIYTVKSGLFKLSDSVSLDNRNDKIEDSINSITNVRNATFGIFKKNSLIGNEPEFDFVTETKKYSYELQDITFLDNEIVYIVNFKPKRGSVKYTGTIYISNETFALIRADYKFYDNRVGDKFNLKLLLGIKYVERNRSGSVAYKKQENGYYYPYYMNEQVDRYFYLDRPIKFKENGNSSNQVAFNFKIEGTFKERSELLVLEIDALPSNEYTEKIESERMNYQTMEKYDPSIWKDYNILEPLKEMKEFKIDSE